MVKVDYLRDGQAGSVNSTLTGKKTKFRDPCNIFIGINCGHKNDGVLVTSVIPNTAADNSDLESHDVITAIDGIRVRNFDELLVQRNTHEPGDFFTLTVERDGQTLDIDAQFLTCDEEEPVEEIEEEIIEEPIVEEPVIEDNVEAIDNALQFEELNAFPNPTFGKLNLRFKGDAVPTVVRITDITGKEVFTQNLNTFDGIYNREINVGNATPGNLIVTINQGSKVISEQVVLLPRA